MVQTFEKAGIWVLGLGAIAAILLIIWMSNSTTPIAWPTVDQATPAVSVAPSPSNPCSTATKLLTAYKRLANDMGKTIPDKKLADLNAKRDAGTITSADLPGFLQSAFPGEFAGQTLADIRKACK